MTLIVFLVLFTQFNVTIIYTGLLVLLFLCCLEFLLPLLLHRKVKGYENKLLAARDTDQSVVTLYGLIRDYFGVRIMNLIIVIVMIAVCLPFIKDLGTSKAEKKKEYLVTNGKQPLVLLHTYKDHFILAPIDFESKEIIPKFKFVKQGDDVLKVSTFELMSIGPLKISDTTVIQEVYDG